MQTEQCIDNLVEKLEAVTPVPGPERIFVKWLFGSLVYIAAGLLLMGVRPDFIRATHSPLFIAELIALGSVIATSMISAALLAFPDVYQETKTAFLPVPAFLLFIVTVSIEYYADNPPAPLPEHNVECLECITILSLIPGAFILYNIRKFASTHYYTAGSVAVLAAFSIGALILRISEENDSIIHLLKWHYFPMIGAGTIGLVLGRLCLKW